MNLPVIVVVAAMAATLLAGCVGEVALSLGSSVASTLIVDNYIKPTFMQTGAESAGNDDAVGRVADGARSRDFRACIDRYSEEEDVHARLAHLQWCQSADITHEERTRLLVAEASLALAAGEVGRFRAAADQLGPGSLMAVHEGSEVDLVMVVKGLSSGRADDAMPPGLKRLLDAGSPSSPPRTEMTKP